MSIICKGARFHYSDPEGREILQARGPLLRPILVLVRGAVGDRPLGALLDHVRARRRAGARGGLRVDAAGRLGQLDGGHRGPCAVQRHSDARGRARVPAGAMPRALDAPRLGPVLDLVRRGDAGAAVGVRGRRRQRGHVRLRAAPSADARLRGQPGVPAPALPERRLRVLPAARPAPVLQGAQVPRALLPHLRQRPGVRPTATAAEGRRQRDSQCDGAPGQEILVIDRRDCVTLI
ncbi:uncharacterized protein LOC119576067 [Penaeus monodon]|uniref:uncharacterized protein LOC119576067 n=1 Tax=Penaeus monodon TaxID=6687 RepID=UPI0018A7A9BF|nr:uncharacterized protein LOC119576067 [Penaeus monodon]